MFGPSVGWSDSSVQMWLIEYQIVTKTYLPSVSTDSSDISDINGSSDSSDNSDSSDGCDSSDSSDSSYSNDSSDRSEPNNFVHQKIEPT